MVKKKQQFNTSSGFVPNLCTGNAILLFYIGSVLLSLLVEFIQRPLIQFDLVHFLIYAFIMALIVFSTVATLCLSRVIINQWSHTITALFCFAVVVFYSLFFNAGIIFFFNILDPGETPLFALARWFLVTAIIGGVLIRFLYLQWYIGHHKRVQLEHEIAALQARIRPHFLFNSLNSISSLVMLDPDKAEDAISDLADLFRASLSKDHESLISEEVEVCKRYLRIEKLRLDKRLEENWYIDDELLDAKMPHLLMQPLIENAIYHGVQLIPEGGTLTVAITKKDGKVEILVSNPLPKDVPEYKKHSNNMAVKNIRMRLRVLFGSRADFSVLKTDERYTAIIHYPCVYS